MEKKQIKHLVKTLLQQDRTLADNDKRLSWIVWATIKDACAKDMLLDYNDYLLLPSESLIARYRRQLEEFNPELRGDTYYIRKNIKEPEVRQEMLDEKWDEIGEINRLRT